MNTLYVYIVFIASLIPDVQKNKIAPPGTIKLTDKLYIDSQPITNFDWSEYLYSLLNNQVETNVETPYLNIDDRCYFVKNEAYVGKAKKLLKGNEYVEYRLDSMLNDPKNLKSGYHPVVSIGNNGNDYFPASYPVLDVNLKEAQDYCAWRTTMVMYSYSMKTRGKRAKYYTKIKYRVPYHVEIEAAKKNYPSQNDQAYYIFAPDPKINLKHLNNKFEELTLDKPIESFGFYSKSRVGFRCVCEILEY
ncbi:hypothetical protein [Haliscomenobacter sp.]|uniref:hypothetical protein n=1 Tax=Haliscomenobacter sp. TaxID=2717303 RepID=UPI003BAC76FF